MARSRACLGNMTLSPAGQTEVRLSEGGEDGAPVVGSVHAGLGQSYIQQVSKLPKWSEEWSEGPQKRILEDMTGKKAKSRPQRVWGPQF